MRLAQGRFPVFVNEATLPSWMAALAIHRGNVGLVGGSNMDDPSFVPFYERLIARFPGYITGRVLVCLLPGLAFLGLHYASAGRKVFQDWSWFLAALIGAAMLCLYYATHTMRTLLPEMNIWLRPGGERVYMTALTRILSDRNFVLAGLFFGLLNCAIGISFGLPYSEAPARATILIGYFLAGFVCGMAVLGIYGICVSIGAFCRNATRSFDFTAPDRCGGTQFLGDALVIFASVTLIVGVMISVYIVETEWTGGNAWWIVALKSSWIVFPYAMSLIALVVPALPINHALRAYKIEQEVLLQDRLAEIRRSLEESHADPAKLKDLREDYKFEQSVREDLHRMRTWPYGTNAKVNYIIVLIPNLTATLKSASTWIDRLSVLPPLN
jgi:hypothetical protein